MKDIETLKMCEDVACHFSEWLYNNRWFHFEDGKWHYTFEQGTAMSRQTYTKHYVKTTRELFTKYLVQALAQEEYFNKQNQ